MGFHVVRDFAPVSLVLLSGCVVVVHPSLPIQNVSELISYARANPGRLNLGTSGPGGSQHFAAALFEQKASVRFTHIPYRGGAPAMLDLVAGRLDIIFSPMAEAMPFVHSQQVRPIGVSRLQRVPSLPTIPTVAETVPGYEFNSWIGIFAPAGTPANIIQAMSKAIADAVRVPDVRQRLEDLGYLPVGGSSEEMADLQRRDVALMEELARLTGLVEN
jgi:tripartite-type tricarboxylate transporter receptor subunit TctC